MKKGSVSIVATTMVLIALTTICRAQSPKKTTAFKTEIPPGTVKIDSNLYIDKVLISNLSYQEFLYWTGKVFGVSSKEYTSIYPDSTWRNSALEYNMPYKNYLTGAAYKDLPVLGVSAGQADKFSKWRSDRVMEYLLIQKKLLKREPCLNSHPDSVFTIERYFKGEYKSKSAGVEFYPEYNLADEKYLPRNCSTQSGFRNVCIWKKWEGDSSKNK